MMRIGILAVQGAFAEHAACVERLGAESVLLRQPSDIRALDALILPGGESTVQGKLLRDLRMLTPLREGIEAGMPVLGTCAGLILLAQYVEGGVPVLGTLPVTVRRNAYGRQLGSFSALGDVGTLHDFPQRYIRAPYVRSVTPGVEVLCVTGERITAVRSGNQLGTAFHPELTADLRIHRMLLDMA